MILFLVLKNYLLVQILLTPLNYKFKNDNKAKRYIGFVAQDVNEIYHEMVNYAEDEDRYTMDYSGFGVIAIKAIHEHQKVIENL